MSLVLGTKEWLKVLDSLANLGICDKERFTEYKDDVAYYFDLEDAIIIEETSLNEIALQLQAQVSIITHDKGDPEGIDQLRIYFRGYDKLEE